MIWSIAEINSNAQVVQDGLELLQEGCISFLSADAEYEGGMVVAVGIDAVLRQNLVVGLEQGCRRQGFRGCSIGEILLRQGNNIV